MAMASDDNHDDDGEEDFAYFRRAPPKLKGKKEGSKRSGSTRSAVLSSSPDAGSRKGRFRGKRIAAARPTSTNLERPVRSTHRTSGSPLREDTNAKKPVNTSTTVKRGHIMSFSSSSSSSASSSSSSSSEAEGGADDASDSDSSPPPLTEKEKKARVKAALRETRTSKRARESSRLAHEEETVVLPSRSAAKGKGKEKGKGRQQDSSDDLHNEAAASRSGRESAAAAPAWQPRKRPRGIPTASQVPTQLPPILAAAPIHDKGPPPRRSKETSPSSASSRRRDSSRDAQAPVSAPTAGPVADVYQLLDDSDDDDNAQEAKEATVATAAAAEQVVDSGRIETNTPSGTLPPQAPDEDEDDPFGLKDLFYLPPPLREPTRSIEEAAEIVEDSEQGQPPDEDLALAAAYDREGDGCLGWIMDDAEPLGPGDIDPFAPEENVDAFADAGADARVPVDTDASHSSEATPGDRLETLSSRPGSKQSEEADDDNLPTPPSELAKTSRFFQQAIKVKPRGGASSASPAEQRGKAVRATPHRDSLLDRKEGLATGTSSRRAEAIEPVAQGGEQARVIETPELSEERSHRPSVTQSQSTGKSGRFRYQEPTELDIRSASSHKRSANASFGDSTGAHRKRLATEREYESPSQALQNGRGREAGESNADLGVVESIPCDLCMRVFPVTALPDHVRDCADEQSNASGSDDARRTAATLSQAGPAARVNPLRRTDGALPPPRRVPIMDSYQAPEEPDVAATLFPSPPSSKGNTKSRQRGASSKAQIGHQSYNGGDREDYPAEMDGETGYGSHDRESADWQSDAAFNARPAASATRAGVPPTRSVKAKERALSQISRPRQQQQPIISIEDDDDDIEEVETRGTSTSRDKGKGRARAESPIAGDIRISELPSPIRRGYYKMLNLDEDGRPNAEVDTERVAKGSALNTAWKGKLPQERYRAGAAATGAAKKSWGTGRKGGGRKKSFTAKGTGRGRPKKK